MRYDSPAVSMNDVSKAAVPGDAPARNMEFSARRPNRTRRRLIAGAFCVILCAWCLFFSVDYARLQRGRPPLFSLSTATEEYASLRITEHYGLFYKIIDYDFGAGRSVLRIGTYFLRPNVPILPEEQA